MTVPDLFGHLPPTASAGWRSFRRRLPSPPPTPPLGHRHPRTGGHVLRKAIALVVVVGVLILVPACSGRWGNPAQLTRLLPAPGLQPLIAPLSPTGKYCVLCWGEHCPVGGAGVHWRWRTPVVAVPHRPVRPRDQPRTTNPAGTGRHTHPDWWWGRLGRSATGCSACLASRSPWVAVLAARFGTVLEDRARARGRQNCHPPGPTAEAGWGTSACLQPAPRCGSSQPSSALPTALAVVHAVRKPRVTSPTRGSVRESQPSVPCFASAQELGKACPSASSTRLPESLVVPLFGVS